MLERSGPGAGPADNVPLQLGALLGDSVAQGRDKLTIIADPALGPFGLWLEQLIAESTGKEGTGVVPLADEPIGSPAVYGDGPAVRLPAGRTARTTPRSPPSRAPASTSSAARSHDLRRHRHADDHVGARDRVLRRAAAHQPVRPAERPGREGLRRRGARRLRGDGPARVGRGRRPVRGAPRPPSAGRSFLVIQAYVTPTAANEAALQELRGELRDALGVATQLGFGPRYLHSTGQLHKGGSRQGIYLQVLAGSDSDVEIPGRPYGFRTVIEAQSRGDAQALRATGQPVARVDLGRCRRTPCDAALGAA